LPLGRQWKWIEVSQMNVAELHERLWGASSDGPLAGKLVLDLGQAAVGPVAATYLGMLGATVVKIEPPKGDHVRAGLPTMAGMSTVFIGNNVGKAAISLDLKTDDGRELALALIRRADVVIENFRGPDVMVSLGLPAGTLLEINPRLVYVQATAFGGSGPLVGMRSNEWVTEALGGFADATGADELPEFSPGTAHFDWTGAMVNTVVALAGLLHVDSHGQGLCLQTSQLGSTVFCGNVRNLVANMAKDIACDEDIFACSDGYVVAPVSVPRWGPSLNAWLSGAGAVPARATPTDSLSRTRADLFQSVRSMCRTLPANEVISSLARVGVPAYHCPPRGTARILHRLDDNPLVAALGLLESIETHWGDIKHPAPHWKFSRTSARIWGSAPELNGNASEVLNLVEGGRIRPVPPVELEARPLVPLSGCRILVHGDGAALAVAGSILKSLGADMADCGTALPGESVGAEWWDRWDGALVDIEADGADAVVRELDGRTSLCLLSSTESAAHVGWSEALTQMVTGMASFVGGADKPIRLGFDVVTFNVGIAAVQALLAQLLCRRESGVVQSAEVSMLRTAVALSQMNIVGESNPDQQQGRMLESYTWPVDHGYRCADRYCLVDLRGNESAWLMFFVRLGREDLLIDSRFNNIDELQLNRYLLPDILEKELAGLTYQELEALVRDELGGTIVPVLSLKEAMSHPQVTGLGFIQGSGLTLVIGLPVSVSAAVRS
jgi:CoA:oxalate CoA-transferase